MTTEQADATANNAPARKAFENWVTDNGQWRNAAKRSGEGYRLMQTNTQWQAWKACAAALEAK